MRGEEFNLTDAAVGARLDHHVDRIGCSGWARHISETVGDGAKMNATHYGVDLHEWCESQSRSHLYEISSRIHVVLRQWSVKNRSTAIPAFPTFAITPQTIG